MTVQSLNRKSIAVAFAILAVNLAALAVVMYRVKAEQEAFLSLRSEDGFLLLDTVTHQMLHHAELTGMQPDAKQIRDLLEQISGHADIQYGLFQGFDGSVLGESPDHIHEQLVPMEEDMDIQEAIFANEPFTRVLSIGSEKSLECVWPIFLENRYVGTMRIGMSLDFIEILNRSFRRNVLITIVLIVLLNAAFLSAFLLNRRLAKDGHTFRMVLDGISDGVLIRDNRGMQLHNHALLVLFPDGIPDELDQCSASTCRIQHGGKTLLVPSKQQ